MSTQQLIDSANANAQQDAAPETSAPPPAPAPQSPRFPDVINPIVAAQTAVVALPPAPPPRWLSFLALFVRLIWPLAVLGCGVALFVVIGASGWLWLVILLILVCASAARPTLPPSLK